MIKEINVSEKIRLPQSNRIINNTTKNLIHHNQELRSGTFEGDSRCRRVPVLPQDLSCWTSFPSHHVPVGHGRSYWHLG